MAHVAQVSARAFDPPAASGSVCPGHLFAALLSSSVIILRARTQTRIEIAASVRLAELLVGDAAKLVSQQVTAEEFLRTLPTQLRSIRHVRIAVKDAAGMPVAAMVRGPEHAPAPAWFAAARRPGS